MESDEPLDDEPITPGELEELLADGTPTRTVVVRQPGSGFAVASFTLAVCGVGFGLVPVLFPVALVFGVLAVAYGVLGRRRGREVRGLALAGLLLGVVSLAVAVVGGVLVMKAVDWIRDETDDLDAEVDRLVEEVEEKVREQVDEIEAEIRAEIDSIVGDVEQRVTRSVEAEVDGVADEVQAGVQQQVDAITSDVTSRVDAVSADITAEIQARFDDLRVEIDDVKARIDAQG